MIGAVIVAGGSGSRMQSARKKQYLALDDRPILAYTLLAFDRYPRLDRIVVVLPEADLDYCRAEILAPLDLKHEPALVAGGQRRQDSVLNGLNALGEGDGMVMIHDGVRPFVRASLIDACLVGAEPGGACIPAILATDTLKRVNPDGIIHSTLDRSQIQLAQTPQTFSIDLIRRSYRLAARRGFCATDDASIAEFAGHPVSIIPGDSENIKITTPLDLVLARAILGHFDSGAAKR